jgi:hypothetical protein
MARYNSAMRRVVRRRLWNDEQKKKRRAAVFSGLMIVWMGGYMSFIFLETLWIAIGLASAWITIFLVVVFGDYADRLFVIRALFEEAGERWEKFCEEVGDPPIKARVVEAFPLVIEHYATIRQRLGEIDDLPAKLDDVVDEVEDDALALAREWLRMDKVFLLFQRGKDINSEPLQGKARQLMALLGKRTVEFTVLLERLVEALNRLEAFELDSEVAVEFGTATGRTDFGFVEHLVSELRDWSACLTRAQEELTREKF